MKTNLDDAISTVAREMTAIEPPASMRADVLGRIARERQRTGVAGAGLPRWAWVGAAAVLVAGVALGLVLIRQPGNRNAGTPGPDAAATVAQAQPVAGATRPTAVVPDSAAARPVATRGARHAVQPTPTGLASDVGPTPLAGPDAIEIVPLGPDAITIPELGVAPLGEIQPITITAAGPGQGEPQRRDQQ